MSASEVMLLVEDASAVAASRAQVSQAAEAAVSRASHAHEHTPPGQAPRRHVWRAYGIAAAASVVAVLCGAWAVYVDSLYSEQLMRNQQASREPVQACTVASRPENTHQLTLTSDQPKTIVVTNHDLQFTIESGVSQGQQEGAMLLSVDKEAIGPGGVTLQIVGEAGSLRLSLEE